MEKFIVALIVIAAAVALIRMFKKQTDGSNACSCEGKCKQCPSDQDKDCG